MKTIPKRKKPDPCTHEAEIGDDSKELDATHGVMFGKCLGILYLAQAQDRPIQLVSARPCLKPREELYLGLRA